MNFSVVCRKQGFSFFKTIRLQFSNKLIKKFSTKVNNSRTYGSRGLFQKTLSCSDSSNFRINLCQSFTINKMCRNITTAQNDTGGTVELTSPQEVTPENINSAADFTDIVEPATSDAIAETVIKIGDFKSMGLANYTPVGLVEGFFEILHVSTGLPWWGTIVLATSILRLGTFPLLVKNQRSVSKLMELQPQIEKIMEEINKAKKNGDQHTIMVKTVEMKQLYSDNNLTPFSPLLLPLIQMPLFISFFMGLKKMSELPVPGFKNDGILWFKDLSVPDPHIALPFLVSAGFILMLELGTEASPMKSSQGRGIRWFFRGLSVISIFFTMELPSSVLLYFLCANMFAFVQNEILKTKKVRRYFGLPIIKPKINEVIKTKSFMEQWREWNANQQVASTGIAPSKKKKHKSRR